MQALNWDAIASVSNVVVAAAAVWVAWHSSSEANKFNMRMLRISLYDKKKSIRDAMLDLIRVRPVEGSLVMEAALLEAKKATADLSLIVTDPEIVRIKERTLNEYALAINARYSWEESDSHEKILQDQLDDGGVSPADYEKAKQTRIAKRKEMKRKYRICEDTFFEFYAMMNQEIRLMGDNPEM